MMLDKKELGTINRVCYQFYSNLPLYELIQTINKIYSFLAVSFSTKVYIHCQDSKMRSAVFLACYLFKTKSEKYQDISEAIIRVNQILGLSIEESQ
jgi:hypothetical protein